MKPKKPKVQTFTFKTTRPIVSNSSTSSGDSGNTISATDVNKIIKGSIKAGKKLKKTTRKIQKSITKAVKNYKKRQRQKEKERKAQEKARKELLKAARRLSTSGKRAKIDAIPHDKLKDLSGEELRDLAIRGFNQTKQQAYRMRKMLGITDKNKDSVARVISDPFGKNLTMKELKNADVSTEEGRQKMIDNIDYIRSVQDTDFLKKSSYEEFSANRFKNIFSNLSDDTMKGEPQIGKFTNENGDKVYGVKMNLKQFVGEEAIVDKITGMPTGEMEKIYEFKEKIYSVADISKFLRKLNQLRKDYAYLKQDKTTLEEIYEAFEKAREEDISIVEAVDRLIKDAEAEMAETKGSLMHHT